MFLARIKQGFLYLFCKYDEENNSIVSSILSKDEMKLFLKMSNYDKLHSFNLLKMVKTNELLKNKPIFFKLALLHDCGKGNVNLLKRIKKVLFGDKVLEQHSANAYNLLKDINSDLATLCLIHHENDVDIFMQEFQKLDDGSI